MVAAAGQKGQEVTGGNHSRLQKDQVVLRGGGFGGGGVIERDGGGDGKSDLSGGDGVVVMDGVMGWWI